MKEKWLSVHRKLFECEALLPEILDRIEKDEINIILRKLQETQKQLTSEKPNIDKIERAISFIHENITTKALQILNQKNMEEVRGLATDIEKEKKDDKILEIQNEIKSMIETLIEMLAEKLVKKNENILPLFFHTNNNQQKRTKNRERRNNRKHRLPSKNNRTRKLQNYKNNNRAKRKNDAAKRVSEKDI